MMMMMMMTMMMMIMMSISITTMCVFVLCCYCAWGRGEGWLKQPHLAQVRLIGLWGWGRLHTCGTMSNNCCDWPRAVIT